MALYGNIDSAVFKNISATPAAFTLKGGCYAITVHATWNTSGTVALNRQAADGSTWVAVLAADISADGFQAINLPPGLYQLAIDTATAVYCDITSLPIQR